MLQSNYLKHKPEELKLANKKPNNRCVILTKNVLKKVKKYVDVAVFTLRCFAKSWSENILKF